MASPLQQIADIITQRAGWKNAVPDEDGVFRFYLEDGLEFSLLSPDNRSAVLLADLGPAPEKNALSHEEECKRLAGLAAAALKKRRSVFSIAGSRMELHRIFPVQNASERDIQLEARDFLNDLAWWSRQLAPGTPAEPPASPFSFNFSSW